MDKLMQKPHVENINFEPDELNNEFNERLAIDSSLKKNSIRIDKLEYEISSIEKMLLEIELSKFIEVEIRIIKAKELIKKINNLYQKIKSHKIFSGLSDSSGFIEIKDKYTAELLSLFYRADDICKSKISANQKKSPLSDQKKSASVINGLTLFKQAYKVQKSYNEIYTGLKYRKAEFNELLNLNSKDIKGNIRKKIHSDIKAIRKDEAPEGTNPIKILSKRNISALKKSLSLELSVLILEKKLPKTASNNFGLLPDEIDLFSALLNLPYKLQHATNNFSEIARNGRLDSLTEIHRHRPEYKSPFSTPSNLEELGNGGFIFMRCYVDGVNSDQTRYGNTRMITDLSLLREIGWISLHDQLVPFPSSNRQQTLYEEKRLLFKATPEDVNNTAGSNKNADGICYEYRTAPIGACHTGEKAGQPHECSKNTI